MATLPASTAIVAVRPTSGQILAVARSCRPGHACAAAAGRALSARAGLHDRVRRAPCCTDGVQLNNSIPCNPVNPVGGQNFTNYPHQPALGSQPPFLTDFAQAADRLRRALAAAVRQEPGGGRRQFGLGARWQLPRPQRVRRSRCRRPPAARPRSPRTPSATGRVQVSPLQAARSPPRRRVGDVASADPGDQPGGSGADPDRPVRAQVVPTLRTLMRRRSTSGAARAANVRGPNRLRPGRDAPRCGRGRALGSLVRRVPGGCRLRRGRGDQCRPCSAASLAGQFLADSRPVPDRGPRPDPDRVRGRILTGSAGRIPSAGLQLLTVSLPHFGYREQPSRLAARLT